ncbi:MAG TPA: SRPBCC family protein [Thermoleophilaceae bacterium]|nr:SRPBCC family protein [Thermoleophilaceae bacterium]
MAKDMSDTVRDALGQVVREAVKNVGSSPQSKKKGSPISGARGIAAGAGLAALAPLAKKGFDAVRGNGISLPSPKPGKVAGKAAKTMGDRVGGKLKEGVSEKVDEAGGAGGLVKEAAGGLLPGGGGDSGGGKGGMPGVGKGRRMPVQQSVDVAVPVETAYNQWTQFEDWPEFMHRVTRVTQEDDCTLSFATKIWGKTKEFNAEIETQRPEERIKWKVSQGITHTGVVTFHELAPRLTRIELNVDVDPGSLIEKAARGMRHIKRAMRADLHRFKAFIEMQELETGAWRGVIEDGELVEEHDDSYDEERDYSDVEDAADQSDGDEDQDEEDADEEDADEDQDEDQRSRSERFKRQAERSSSRSGGGSSRSRSKSSSSRGSGNSKPSSSGTRSRSSGQSKSRSRGSSNGGGGSSSKKSGSSRGGGRKSSSRS